MLDSSHAYIILGGAEAEWLRSASVLGSDSEGERGNKRVTYLGRGGSCREQR